MEFRRVLFRSETQVILLMKKIIRRISVCRQPPLERRLHRRALLYWHSMNAGKEFVDLDQFDPMAIEDRSAHGFMLDLTSAAGPTCCYIGPVLRDEAGVRTETIRSEEHTSEPSH